MIRPGTIVGGMREQAMRLALMEIAEQLVPLHELAAGEVAYFVRQGFTIEQAHAMVAAEFITVFGANIEAGATRPDDEGPHPEG